MSAAIWSSESPRATQNGFVMGSIAEMSSLKSRAKRITAQMPGRRSSATIGSASASVCCDPRLVSGSTNDPAASAAVMPAPARKAASHPRRAAT